MGVHVSAWKSAFLVGLPVSMMLQKQIQRLLLALACTTMLFIALFSLRIGYSKYNNRLHGIVSEANLVESYTRLRGHAVTHPATTNHSHVKEHVTAMSTQPATMNQSDSHMKERDVSARHTSITNHSLSVTRGHVVALSFGEQLESGIYDLYQLADVAHSWNMTVVEPFIDRTWFKFPSLRKDEIMTKLGDVYNLRELNNNLKKSMDTYHDLIIQLSDIADSPYSNTEYQVVVLYLLSKSLSRADCLQHYQADTKSHISAVRSHVSNIRLLRNITLACVNAKLKTNFRRIFQYPSHF